MGCSTSAWVMEETAAKSADQVQAAAGTTTIKKAAAKQEPAPAMGNQPKQAFPGASPFMPYGDCEFSITAAGVVDAVDG